jgi:hypothetical protein
MENEKMSRKISCFMVWSFLETGMHPHLKSRRLFKKRFLFNEVLAGNGFGCRRFPSGGEVILRNQRHAHQRAGKEADKMFHGVCASGVLCADGAASSCFL